MTDENGVEYHPPGSSFALIILIGIAFVTIPLWKVANGKAQSKQEYLIGGVALVVAAAVIGATFAVVASIL